MATLFEPFARFFSYLALLVCIWMLVDWCCPCQSWVEVSTTWEDHGSAMMLLLLLLACGFHFCSGKRGNRTATWQYTYRDLALPRLLRLGTRKSAATQDDRTVRHKATHSEGQADASAAISSLKKEALLDGWESAWSDSDERHYYFNHQSGETTWVKPISKVLE